MENASFAVYVAILSIVFTWLLYRWATSTHDHWEKLNIPYVKPVPFFGSALPFVRRKENFCQMMRRIYCSLEGHPYGGYFEMRQPILMIRDPKLVYAILVKDFHHFRDRQAEQFFNVQNHSLNPVSASVATLTGDRWKFVRSRLSIIFTASKLNAMRVGIASCVAKTIDLMFPPAGETEEDDVNSPGISRRRRRRRRSVELRKAMINYAIDATSVCILGVDCSSDDRTFLEIVQKSIADKNDTLRFLLSAIHPKMLTVCRVPDFSEELTDFFRAYVERSIIAYKKSSIMTTSSIEKSKGGFLQTMMKIIESSKNNEEAANDGAASDNFEEIDIVGNSFIFFLAGFETMATTLAYCLHELTFNRTIQDKLRREIADVKINSYDENKILESMKQLKYLDAVLAETLRKYAVMSTLFRICTKDYSIPTTDHIIPKGTKILIPIHAIHTDPHIFPDPQTFDPDRFLPEKRTKLQNGCYIPFGEGPRFCFGMRFTQLIMKTMLMEIVTNFTLEPNEKSEYNVKYRSGRLFSEPQNGLWINATRLSRENK